MREVLKKFAKSEDGAITVDWVVLTALVLGVQVMLLLTPMRDSLVGVSESIADKALEYEQFLE
jgi:Flp pilus assembly pilin Flp